MQFCSNYQINYHVSMKVITIFSSGPEQNLAVLRSWSAHYREPLKEVRKTTCKLYCSTR